MFDIAKQDFAAAAEAGYSFELMLPTGVGSGAKLTILGDMSPSVKAFSRKRFQELQMRQAMLKRKGKDFDEIDLDEAEDAAVEAALVRLVDWSGISNNGKALEFSKDAARELLKKNGWIREQIMNEAADVTNFQPK